MKKVDAFLSRKAQEIWPTAVVYKLEDGRFYVERQEGVLLELGSDFGEAKSALVVLLSAEKARKS